jgi:hypothetical protein
MTDLEVGILPQEQKYDYTFVKLISMTIAVCLAFILIIYRQVLNLSTWL